MQIYLTINKINDKIYIGQSINHINLYYGSGLIIKQAIKKYGKDNFVKVILKETDNLEELNELEKHYIKLFNSTDPEIGYNIKEGGLNSKCSDETKSKMSESSKNKKHSAETKLKIRESAKNMSDTTKQKLREINTGKKHSDESKIKMSISKKGKIFSEKHKLNLSLSHKGQIPWNKGKKLKIN